jgi:5-methylcytosine-specific restriction endonuclease McrA
VADFIERARAVQIALNVIGRVTDDPEYVARIVARNRSRNQRRRDWLQRRHSRNPRCFYCRCTTTLDGSARAKISYVVGEAQFATLDHANPLSRGGQDHTSNYRLACVTCNQLKGSMPEKAFIAELKREGIRD